MRRRYVTVDVFTDQPFGGNPLAVVLDAEGLSAAQMQALAAEFNYSETTFVLPPRDPAHTAQVRIFTPNAEIPFAGHPNVGTAFVLGGEGRATGDVVFEEKAGLVAMRLLDEGGETIGAELTAPQPLSRGASFALAEVAAALGLAVEDIANAQHPPCVASVGLAFAIVELASREALARLRPDLAGFRAMLPSNGADAVFAYAVEADAAVHARMVWPGGVTLVEDPATGSATAALMALLADLDPHLDVLLVHQGVDMGRPSLLHARVRREQGRVASVHVGGRCVPMFSGTFAMAGER